MYAAAPPAKSVFLSVTGTGSNTFTKTTQAVANDCQPGHTASVWAGLTEDISVQHSIDISC